MAKVRTLKQLQNISFDDMTMRETDKVLKAYRQKKLGKRKSYFK